MSITIEQFKEAFAGQTTDDGLQGRDRDFARALRQLDESIAAHTGGNGTVDGFQAARDRIVELYRDARRATAPARETAVQLDGFLRQASLLTTRLEQMTAPGSSSAAAPAQAVPPSNSSSREASKNAPTDAAAPRQITLEFHVQGGQGMQTGGTRLANATVQIGGQTQTTDGEGFARFSLAPAVYDYRVSADGHQELTGRVDVSATADVERHGVVLSPLNAPREDVIVRVLDVRTRQPLEEAFVAFNGELEQSNRAGEARFIDVATGADPYGYEVRKTGYERLRGSFVHDGTQGTSILNVELQPAATTPADPAQTPAGDPVQAPAGGAGTAGAGTAGQRPADAPGTPPPTGASRQITLEFHVQGGDRMQTGGTRLANATVQIGGQTQTTDGEGFARFSLAPAVYDYRVSADAHQELTGRVDVSATADVERHGVVLNPLNAPREDVIVRVFDARTRQPIEEAFVAFNGELEQSNRAGEARFIDVATGADPYGYEVRKTGYERLRGSFVHDGTQGTSILNVELQPAATTPADPAQTPAGDPAQAPAGGAGTGGERPADAPGTPPTTGAGDPPATDGAGTGSADPPAGGPGTAPGTAGAGGGGSASQHTSQVLRRRSRGPAVAFLQEQLNQNGARLEVDQIFGEQTDRAVRSFQQAHGLAADGIVGPNTWAALTGIGASGATTGGDVQPPPNVPPRDRTVQTRIGAPTDYDSFRTAVVEWIGRYVARSRAAPLVDGSNLRELHRALFPNPNMSTVMQIQLSAHLDAGQARYESVRFSSPEANVRPRNQPPADDGGMCVDPTIDEEAGMCVDPTIHVDVTGNGGTCGPAEPNRSGSTSTVDDLIGAATTIATTAADAALELTGRGGTPVARAMGPIGAAVTFGTTAYNQWENADTQSTAATAAQAGAAATLTTAYSVAYPGLAVAEAAVTVVNNVAGTNIPTLSGTTNNSINNVATLGEAMVTGETAGVENLHEENLSGANGQIFQQAAATGEVFTAYYDAVDSGNTRALEQYHENARAGDYGAVMQASAEAGDYWAEHSIADAAEEVWDGVTYLAEDWF